MAISQMKKLAMVFEKDYLDLVLKTLQQSQLVEVRDMKQLKHWQDAFNKGNVKLPQIVQYDLTHQKPLLDDEALQYLLQSQQELENGLASLSAFLPPIGKLTALRQKTPSLSFKQFEESHRQQAAQTALKMMSQKIERLEQLQNKIDQLTEYCQELEKWRSLTVLPQDLAQFHFLSARVGTIPSTANDHFYHQLKQHKGLFIEEVYHTEFEYGLVLFWQAQDTIHLQKYQFKPLLYKEQLLPSEQLRINKELLTNWLAEKDSLLKELRQSQKILAQLQVEIDYVLSQYQRQQTKKQLLGTRHLIALEGWIEADSVNQLKGLMTKTLGDMFYLDSYDVTPDDWEDVPIKLRNHRYIAPFELVTEMYALPKYQEKDPTPFLAPLYLTFFGMMVADLGYGLLLYAVTLAALVFFNLQKTSKRLVTFFNILAISVAIWGLIYGSFFGFDLPVALLSTKTDVITILVVSLLFGFVTLIFGLLLGAWQQVRMKAYATAYMSSLAWTFILLGLLLFILGKNVSGLAYLSVIGKWLALGNAFGILVVSLLKSKSLLGLGSGLYNLYGISSYLSDLVSFTRLMALGLSGASIGAAFNMIVGIFPPVTRFTVGIFIFILLHAINIFLSMLSGYVHGARLIFVEFFGKFYEGGGKAFNPLKLADNYVNVNEETDLEDN
ncbi:TPA: V-type ATP synthase subunit I [Streptococcus pyogenes]|uniref:V-type ATP synthase subunit I n=1 Tax=Streptococcus pyogenes TaxID=1314 RepID=UPI00109CAEEE|nr:V-type ATP synthase subunit I [Streptococcus pyogenes]VGX64812.1 V-type ATPase 116kDa subunit [Streptococcus pyogenes]VHF02909.1 V-type ATPase 116kDa subunit [Streptococcus pyogenes]VHG36687.1 V-type ATPase 116kDa subunit [Streptococcus pyogenes]HEQ8272203.1 V-type ATP synthase subunit I [Streptococcus pyogenes]